MTEEIRTTSSTGGQKGVKPARYSFIPTIALDTLARMYGRGAEKYEETPDHPNWRKGYEWSKSYDAMMRHATAFWGGEDNDPEMGLPHMAAVMFHASTLITFMKEHPEFDDRYKPDAAITSMDIGSFGRKSEGEIIDGTVKRAEEIWAEVRNRANDARSWAAQPDHGLIVHETINHTPGDTPIAHFDILRDGRVVHNLDIGLAHVESVQEQVRDTTQESYDAWDAGRPFGSAAIPADEENEK